MSQIAIPKIPENCKVCNHFDKFAIQKAIDNNVKKSMICKEFNITSLDITRHINGAHRDSLLELGIADYVLRRKNIDVGLTLSSLIEKWATGVPTRMPETIKDADAIRAMELYLKSQGGLVNKHEVKVTRTVDDALTEFLSDDAEDDTEEVTEEVTEQATEEVPEEAIE